MQNNFFDRVEISKLSRDFTKLPLGTTESPTEEDLRYLFFDLKFSATLIGIYFNKSRPTVDKWIHKFGFVRSKEDLQTSKLLFMEYKCGHKVNSSFELPGAYEKFKKAMWKDGVYQNNVEKGKQTKLEKYGDAHYNNYEQHKKTCLERYGETSFSKTKEFGIKRDKTNLERYGRTNVCQFGTKEHLDAMISKYGVAHAAQVESCMKKTKETCIRRFGKSNYFQTDEYRNKYKNKEWVKEIKEKEYLTRKKKGIFNKSYAEDEVYDILVGKFGKEDVIRQYKSDLYPYRCDFYIVSKDLYIEYNGSWTHGKEPFNKDNPDHISLVNKWLEKAEESGFDGSKKDYYLIAVHVWTELDVEKRTLAKNNGLNYKEFWSLEEVKSWVEL